MNKKPEPELPDAFLWLKDAPRTPAPERFTSEQMIECEACGRRNAPTRLACLYCGAKFTVDAAKSDFARPTLRRLETWEKGWNVVYLPQSDQEFDMAILPETAELLKLERGELERILTANEILPLARAETETEAFFIAGKLRENNFVVEVVADAELQPDVLPLRIRGLEFGGSYLNLSLLGRDETVCLFYAEVELIVTGAIFSRQIENRERRKSEDRFEIKESREISRDENLLDFYAQGDKTGYRIAANNFDFSCLGAEKKMLAGENFQILLERLREKASRAEFVDAYRQTRAALNLVWQLDERTESLGWQRDGIGKISVENRLTVTNAAQFLRFSRLRRELKSLSR